MTGQLLICAPITALYWIHSVFQRLKIVKMNICNFIKKKKKKHIDISQISMRLFGNKLTAQGQGKNPKYHWLMETRKIKPGE